jgi:hypothetical protein
MKKVILGAPSLTGKDANDLVAAHFKDAAFPLMLVVANLAAFSLSFPEIAGLHLKPCTHGDEATVTVEVPNYEALQRLASSIEQVADLNRCEAMLELSVFDAEAERLEAERLEAERLEAERLEAERLEAERAANPTTGKKK